MATILFVDDDEVERIFARELLEPRGHRVLFAPDGESALEIYSRPDLEIDVVVTDLAMPRLNGLRLIKALREMDPEVQIIAASGVSADQLDLAEEFGALRTLTKPWTPPSFVEAVDQALRVGQEWQEEVWEDVWPTTAAEPEEAPGSATRSPGIPDLIGVWTGDEHVFPTPWSPRGAIAEGWMAIRPVLGDTALLVEQRQVVDERVRRQSLSLLLWVGFSGDMVRYDFVAGSGTPTLYRGAWEGAVLRVERPDGQILHETSWHENVLTHRSWARVEGENEPVLSFEARYERVREGTD